MLGAWKTSNRKINFNLNFVVALQAIQALFIGCEVKSLLFGFCIRKQSIYFSALCCLFSCCSIVVQFIFNKSIVNKAHTHALYLNWIEVSIGLVWICSICTYSKSWFAILCWKVNVWSSWLGSISKVFDPLNQFVWTHKTFACLLICLSGLFLGVKSLFKYKL